MARSAGVATASRIASPCFLISSSCFLAFFALASTVSKSSNLPTPFDALPEPPWSIGWLRNAKNRLAAIVAPLSVSTTSTKSGSNIIPTSCHNPSIASFSSLVASLNASNLAAFSEVIPFSELPLSIMF